MRFERHPGIDGKIFIPVHNPETPQKHKCKDCFSCQMCSDERCQICRSDPKQPVTSKNIPPEKS